MSAFEDMLEGFEPLVDVEAINTLADPDKDITLRLDQLVPYPGNREIKPEKAELMAETLRANGQLQNILVRPLDNGMYEICAGHTRYYGQLNNAEQYPDEPAYRTLKATVRTMSDAEMAVNNGIANLYMDPPTAAERAKLYELLSRYVPEMRMENPELYAGVPTAQIVADTVNDLGGSTSRATVNRDLKAAREHTDADSAIENLDKSWKGDAEAGVIDDASIVRLADLDARTQRQVRKDYEANGRKKSYLAERIACTDATDAERLMLRSVKGIVSETERLLRIRKLGWYVELDYLAQVHALLDELAALEEEDGQ